MSKIEILLGDIVTVEADALVNSNNTNLISNEGSGVNGAIIKAGGAQIKEELQRIIVKLGDVPPGQVVMTSGGNLKARYVIHAISPVWQGGDFREETLLTDCFDNAMKLAVEKGLKTIAFPSLGAGNYKFPKQIAAEIAIGTVHWFLNQPQGQHLDKVIMVCHNQESYNICKEELEKLESRKA